MEESEDNITSESWIKADNNSAVKIKPKKRSLVERELETNLTARVTSPVTTGDGTSTSRYGRARRLKTESESTDSRKMTLEVLKTTQPEKSPNKLQSPVYKMHASNSPIRTISPKRAPVDSLLENQIESIYQENKSLSRFSTDEIVKNSPCKNQKIYTQKDLIQSRQPEEAIVLIKSIFSPSKGSDKTKNTHLSNILERSSDKFNLINNDNSQNGFFGNPSVVKTLDFDNKKKKKENKDIKYLSKNDLFELEAKCMYQVGDLAWSRMGTYPFWPCIVTRDPTTGIYVKKKLFGRVERDIIHVTFFGDNGRRGWIVDSMLRKFKGLAEFETTRDRFTPEDKKKDPRLYAAFFISDKKQALWHISVEEAETLMREPKRLRIELLNDMLENSRSYKSNPKTQKSGKVTRTDSDVSLSESLYDTLFSEDDGKTDDSERSKNKSRNKSLDVSEVVTACLDNMAAKTGITKIQRQSHMDRWLQKAKSNTPEKTHVKAQIPKIGVDNNLYNSKKRKSHKELKPYNLRKSPNESHNLLAYHNEHDYSKFVSDDDNSSIKTNISDGNIENKYEFVPLEESGAGIGVITKIESLADNKEQSNIEETTKDNDFTVTNNRHTNEVVFENVVSTLTEEKTQNIESNKLNMAQEKEVDINDYNSDQQISGCSILNENENYCCDTNATETDSTFNSNSCLENSKLQNFIINSKVSNQSSMEMDNITNGGDINNSSAILDKNNLSINVNNVSIVDSEMSIDNENHDILTKSPNLYPEESNIISINNHINFSKEESNGSVVSDIRIGEESTVNKGDNIVLDLKSLRKNNCVEVNINTEDSFLDQTESAFLHSIKSTHEDNLEDANNINTNNLSEETKIILSSNSNLVSTASLMNNVNIYDNNEIPDEFEMIKSLHLDTPSDNSKAEKVDDKIKKTEELCENHAKMQEKKNSIVQEVNENIDLETNNSTSNNVDDNNISSQTCYNNSERENELAFSINSKNALIMVADIKLTPTKDKLTDTISKEKNEMYPEEFLKINGFRKTETRAYKLMNSNETIDTLLAESDNEITLKTNLKDTICIEKTEQNTGESPKSLKINGFQETETNNLGEINDEKSFINSEASEILSSKEKYYLQSDHIHKEKRIKERNNPEFLKYVELRQDAVMDEHPELDEDKIITYLYQTWLYEESQKSDIKKINNLEESSSIKGLDDPNPKKRSRRLKALNSEGKKNKSITERKYKDSASESVIPETSQNSKKSDLSSKWPSVMVESNLSMKNNSNRVTPSPIGDLSDTKKDNITVNISKTNESNIKVSCNTELEILTKPKYDTVNHNIDERDHNIDEESEIMCTSVDITNKDKLHPILFNLLSDSMPNAVNNVSEINNDIQKHLQDETESVDSEASDLPLIYQKLQIKSEENDSNENKSPKFSKEEFESNESIISIDSETSLNNTKEKLTNDREMMNTLHRSPEVCKEESENNNDSFNSTDSETRFPKRKTKRDREKVNTLIVNLETNKEKTESNNDSLKNINLETSLIKPKQKNKYDKKAINPFDDPEFQKYQELRRDNLIEENPQLTQEEITNYLYKTWLYEENNKSDLRKTDVIAQSSLVKGLDQEIVPPKKIKKKVKVPKAITDYFEVSPKEKPKRKIIKPYYNEDYYDIEQDIESFEINSDCSSSNKTVIEQSQQINDKPLEDNQSVYEIEEQEEIDEVEIYFSELTKPKPNIFKGLLREKVCEICEKTGNLVKCKTCHGMFHVNCAQTESKVVEISTPMRGRKKKRKAGRKPKNSEDSEGHSDDKQDVSEDNNVSIEEIETEFITVDAVTLETQLYEKMKELLENTESVNYDSYSSDNELDWNDTIAGKCEIVDVKLKRKSSDAYVDYSDFKCNHCLKDDTPVCFVCKSDISKNESKIRQRCQVPHCHKYYHLECLDHWPQTQFNAGEPSKYKKVNEHFESLTCPRHVCHTCVSDDPRGCKTRFSGDKLARCIRCPATYHTFTKCVPAGSQILTASHIICPRHYKHRPGKVPCHVNTGWCFICALGGSLICCEYCPTSFHAECLNIDPPEGGYMCEDCETGRLPLYGEMVWVKLGHYRWWPGLILHPSEIPQNIMAVKHSQGEFVVRFFGQYDYYWVNRGRVFPFQEGDSGRISSQKSKIDAAFTTAMEHAQRACAVLKSAMPNEEESMDIASSLLPPHYVKLKVNKPCGSLCGRKLDDPELSLTQCDCNPDEEDPCGPYSQCLNRMLLTECGPSCRAGDRCNNRAFEKRLYPKLVPYRTPHRGWGLKTLEDIKAGQFVIEYVGELIDEEEFKRRMRRKHEIRDENFYFLTLDKERMIDAGPKGNLARFMNHCCEPNCETQKWTVLGDVRVGLFALYDIPANSEVTFNYNLESAGIEKKRCLCGAKRCSGYIGAKPKQEESQPKKGKVPVKRTYKKRKVEESSPSTGKVKSKRLGRPPKPKELSDIEKDLLIIRNATGGMSSDDSSRSLSSEGDRLPKPLKRKRVSFSTEEVIHIERSESPSMKRKKYNEKEVGD